MTDIDYVDVEDLNRSEVMRQIPLFIYLIIIGIIGTIGNLLVCIIYKNKYPSSNCRTFVLVLSVVDIFTSLFGIPLEILFLFREYNFRNAWICKASVFVNTLPTLTSGFLLLAIAIDRYRKVCKPFSWQISKRAAKWMCVFTAVAGVAFSWISPIIYGIQKQQHAIYNVTISQCIETDAMKQTLFPLLNNIFFAVLFIGALAGIIVMYCFIAVNVKRHHERKSQFMSNRGKYYVDQSEASELTVKSGKVVLRKKTSKEKDVSDALFGNSDTLGDGIEPEEVPYTNKQIVCNVDSCIERKNDDENRKSILSRILSFGRSSLSLSRTFSTASNASSINHNIIIKPVKRRQKYRTAFIMFLISLAFVISYLPLLCLLLIRTLNSTFVVSLNDQQRTAYKFFLRSYLINCACNPVIYGLCDKRFRKHCKKLICKRTK